MALRSTDIHFEIQAGLRIKRNTSQSVGVGHNQICNAATTTIPLSPNINIDHTALD